MGSGGSKGKSFEDVVNHSSFRESMVLFNSLQVTSKDLKKIFKVFTSMDIDTNGTISLTKLLIYLNLPYTAYTEKIFSIFDDDGSGTFDFRKFILTVWNYCTVAKLNLDMFVFDLYNTDGSGKLSPAEVLKLLQEIFGKEEMRTNIHAKSASTEINKFQQRNENFDAAKFRNLIGYHHAMLFPTIQMQQALLKKVGGAGFWEKHTKQREARSNGVYVSLAHFMVAKDTQISSSSSTLPEGGESGKSTTSVPTTPVVVVAPKARKMTTEESPEVSNTSSPSPLSSLDLMISRIPSPPPIGLRSRGGSMGQAPPKPFPSPTSAFRKRASSSQSTTPRSRGGSMGQVETRSTSLSVADICPTVLEVEAEEPTPLSTKPNATAAGRVSPVSDLEPELEALFAPKPALVVAARKPSVHKEGLSD